MRIFAIRHYHNRGFTLVEMAVVLVILGFLLGGLLVPLSAQIEQKNYSVTQKDLSEIKEALIGYALSHPALDGKPHLPCPDSVGDDGLEDRAGTTCASPEGNLPWSDLGLPAQDGWGNRYRYRVTDLQFADNSLGFTLASNGNITVRDAAAGNIIASSIPAVVFSRGKNGAGAGADEAENSNIANSLIVSHEPKATAGNEFDDMVVWIPTGILFNRMVTAGLLP
ncbi:MAG: prepilin-type N-terminal cleavage/methylation domain-containing protein [Methylotenera sp.]